LQLVLAHELANCIHGSSTRRLELSPAVIQRVDQVQRKRSSERSTSVPLRRPLRAPPASTTPAKRKLDTSRLLSTQQREQTGSESQGEDDDSMDEEENDSSIRTGDNDDSGSFQSATSKPSSNDSGPGKRFLRPQPRPKIDDRNNSTL